MAKINKQDLSGMTRVEGAFQGQPKNTGFESFMDGMAHTAMGIDKPGPSQDNVASMAISSPGGPSMDMV